MEAESQEAQAARKSLEELLKELQSSYEQLQADSDLKSTSDGPHQPPLQGVEGNVSDRDILLHHVGYTNSNLRLEVDMDCYFMTKHKIGYGTFLRYLSLAVCIAST